ncbi:hypothetical protein F5Y15DRAFT_373733 [Xylariaceae sp. FL0016]|nr:hypothetical protein F5Y15DRAFT_373733 [Xylariaceae sp. FL0016]
MVAALFGTIYPYRGKPQPQWPYDLSINTIVGFYAEVMKTTMVLVLGECISQLKWSWFKRPRPLDHLEDYDSASRGPWGALILIVALRARAILPTIGALIMILQLLLSPFAQQVLQFYACTVLDTATDATIPTTHVAAAATSVHIGANRNALDYRVQAAMNSGVYDDEMAQVQVSCTTGNCTFPGVYASAGWCSSCTDITDQLVITERTAATNFTLPSTNLSALAGADTFVMGYGLGSTVQAILGWSADGSDQLADTPWGRQGYGAAECRIDPCVRSYTANVSAGNLVETVVDVVNATWDEDRSFWTMIDMSCLDASEEDALRGAGYTFDDSTTWLTYNLSRDLSTAYNTETLNETMTTIRTECIYQSYSGQYLSLADYLGNMFSGSVAFAPGALGGDTILQTIFQEGNVTFSTIDDAFSRVANALTVWNRQGNNVTVGQTYKAETCVSARWEWLAYPLALAVGTLLVLVWTMLETRRFEGSDQDYKSSVLALLFHKVGDVGSEGPITKIESGDRLKAQAKEMTVVFSDVGQAWRFVQVPTDTQLRSGSMRRP